MSLVSRADLDGTWGVHWLAQEILMDKRGLITGCDVVTNAGDGK